MAENQLACAEREHDGEDRARQIPGPCGKPREASRRGDGERAQSRHRCAEKRQQPPRRRQVECRNPDVAREPGRIAEGRSKESEKARRHRGAAYALADHARRRGIRSGVRLGTRGQTPRSTRAFQRARAFSRSRSRVLTAVCALREASSLRVAAATSSAARSNAAASAAPGFASPLTLRTYWTAAARISSAVVGGSKL